MSADFENLNANNNIRLVELFKNALQQEKTTRRWNSKSTGIPKTPSSTKKLTFVPKSDGKRALSEIIRETSRTEGPETPRKEGDEYRVECWRVELTRTRGITRY